MCTLVHRVSFSHSTFVHTMQNTHLWWTVLIIECLWRKWVDCLSNVLYFFIVTIILWWKFYNNLITTNELVFNRLMVFMCAINIEEKMCCESMNRNFDWGMNSSYLIYYFNLLLVPYHFVYHVEKLDQRKKQNTQQITLCWDDIWMHDLHMCDCVFVWFRLR